jgi:hypothetical protein
LIIREHPDAFGVKKTPEQISPKSQLDHYAQLMAFLEDVVKDSDLDFALRKMK